MLHVGAFQFDIDDFDKRGLLRIPRWPSLSGVDSVQPRQLYGYACWAISSSAKAAVTNFFTLGILS
jgi:hypothetical protein